MSAQVQAEVSKTLGAAGVTHRVQSGGNLFTVFFTDQDVVDFINYAGFFVGNVADIAIVGAAVVVVWLSFRGVPFGDEAPAGAVSDDAPDGVAGTDVTPGREDATRTVTDEGAQP